MAAHVVFGIVALLAGPIQFSTRLRTKHLQAHRLIGRGYLISVLLVGIAGLYLAFTSSIGLAYAWGLGSLALTWMTSGGLALVAIRRRNIAQHKEWMVRSYVITFAFVVFRLGESLLEALKVGDQVNRLTLMSWASWALPLFFAEVVLQAKKIGTNAKAPS